MKEKLKRSATVMTACLPAIILIIWLNAYYWLLEGGRYTAFIQPKLWPLLILALVLLLAFTAASIAQFSLKSISSFQFSAWAKATILIIPVVFLWTIYGQSLGTDAFAKRILQPGPTVPLKVNNSGKIPSKAIPDNATSLLDLILYTEEFNGKAVAVEGMVYRGAKAEKNTFMLFRFAVTCCAADAVPFSIGVKTAIAEDLPNDAWIRVEGHFRFETINEKQILSIVADNILTIPTPPPEKRYMFF
jgi:putative membrane protein